MSNYMTIFQIIIYMIAGLFVVNGTVYCIACYRVFKEIDKLSIIFIIIGLALSLIQIL